MPRPKGQPADASNKGISSNANAPMSGSGDVDPNKNCHDGEQPKRRRNRRRRKGRCNSELQSHNPKPNTSFSSSCNPLPQSYSNPETASSAFDSPSTSSDPSCAVTDVQNGPEPNSGRHPRRRRRRNRRSGTATRALLEPVTADGSADFGVDAAIYRAWLAYFLAYFSSCNIYGSCLENATVQYSDGGHASSGQVWLMPLAEQEEEFQVAEEYDDLAAAWQEAQLEASAPFRSELLAPTDSALGYLCDDADCDYCISALRHAS